MRLVDECDSLMIQYAGSDTYTVRKGSKRPPQAPLRTSRIYSGLN